MTKITVYLCWLLSAALVYTASTLKLLWVVTLMKALTIISVAVVSIFLPISIALAVFAHKKFAEAITKQGGHQVWRFAVATALGIAWLMFYAQAGLVGYVVMTFYTLFCSTIGFCTHRSVKRRMDKELAMDNFVKDAVARYSSGDISVLADLERLERARALQAQTNQPVTVS